jgi:hypothetical protein
MRSADGRIEKNGGDCHASTPSMNGDYYFIYGIS